MSVYDWGQSLVQFWETDVRHDFCITSIVIIEDDGGSRFLQNIGTYLSEYMTTLEQMKFIPKWVGDFV